MKKSVIIIGALGVGKSTVAAALSEKLSIKNYPIDKVKWYFALKNGLDINRLNSKLYNKGALEYVKYFRKYFNYQTLEIVLDEFIGITDFGATDTYTFSNKESLLLKKILSPKNCIVFNLIPSINNKKNTQILDSIIKKRCDINNFSSDITQSFIDLNHEILRDNINEIYARHTILTLNKPVNLIANEIIRIIQTEHQLK